VTKALRGVFVSSLKLAAFHAGFTWLTLRAFGTHFVCTATVASAIVAVLPLVPVALVALPAVLELVLLRAAPVKGLVLLSLHLGEFDSWLGLV
jgi:predicted PurR-regulated permease PerM